MVISMKYVYIVLSYSGTKASRFLKLFTSAKYTHVSICLDKNLNTFYSFARRNIKMPIFGGFVIEHPDEGIFGMYPAICKIYRVPVTEKQYRGIQKDIKSMLSDYDNHKYNFLGCLLIFFGIRYKRQKKFTCTQFVDYVLKHNGVNITNVPWELCKPQDFDKPGMNNVYIGAMKDLIKS